MLLSCMIWPRGSMYRLNNSSPKIKPWGARRVLLIHLDLWSQWQQSSLCLRDMISTHSGWSSPVQSCQKYFMVNSTKGCRDKAAHKLMFYLTQYSDEVHLSLSFYQCSLSAVTWSKARLKSVQKTFNWAKATFSIIFPIKDGLGMAL